MHGGTHAIASEASARGRAAHVERRLERRDGELVCAFAEVLVAVLPRPWRRVALLLDAMMTTSSPSSWSWSPPASVDCPAVVVEPAQRSTPARGAAHINHCTCEPVLPLRAPGGPALAAVIMQCNRSQSTNPHA